jgi:hypothetical protein
MSILNDDTSVRGVMAIGESWENLKNSNGGGGSLTLWAVIVRMKELEA